MPPRPAVSRQQRAAWIVVVVSLAAQLWGLYTPTLPQTGIDVPLLDKVAHLVLFAIPTWALLRVVPRAWMALVPMIVHVPVSELIQALWLPQRSGDAWDAVADLVGIAVGWWTLRTSDRGETSPA